MRDPGHSDPAQYPTGATGLRPIPIGPVPSPLGIVESSFLKGCLLLPCHGGSTLRALLLYAGHSTFMRFAMPAFRTQAGAGRAPGEGTAHAAVPLPSTRPRPCPPPGPLGPVPSPLGIVMSSVPGDPPFLPCSFPPPGPIPPRRSSIQAILVLPRTAHASAMASAATAATGHDKGVALQTASEPGLDDIAQVAGDERDHPDAICGDHLVERPGDRAANQCTDAKLRQTMRLLYRQVIRKDFPRFCDDSSRVGLDDLKIRRAMSNTGAIRSSQYANAVFIIRGPSPPFCTGREHSPCQRGSHGNRTT